MRKFLLAACAAALSFGPAIAAPADEAQAIIEHAIKAHGGLERLARIHADRVMNKGFLFVNGNETPSTDEARTTLLRAFEERLAAME